MSEIREMTGREILDSRGNPTLEVEVELESGAFGRASVPSGASTGSGEAKELRDGDKNRFRGLGVRKAIENIEERIAPELHGEEACDQLAIDQLMIALDGTPVKEKFGANAILGVSIAVARAAASELQLPLYRHLGGFHARRLPVPMMNLINGGRHSDAPSAFQEYMIRPVGADDFATALEMGCEVFHALKALLHDKGFSTAVGDEGGFVPQVPGGAQALLELLFKATEATGLRPGDEIRFALDCAATEFFRSGFYDYREFEGGKAPRRNQAEQIDFLEKLVGDYPIDSIEDGMAENDWEGWSELTDRLGDRCQLVGDDLFVTNTERLFHGAECGAANAILIKPNQIGTLTETFDAIEAARQSGYLPIISHRSGETEDTAIADIAVAANAGQIKAGPPSRTDRTAKYNQLLRIEEELGSSAIYGW